MLVGVAGAAVVAVVIVTAFVLHHDPDQKPNRFQTFEQRAGTKHGYLCLT